MEGSTVARYLELGCVSSCSRRPSSTTRPSSSTTIRWALATVRNRCAATRTARPLEAKRDKVEATASSVSPSKAEVGSSIRSTGAPLAIALAIASLCRWPPESREPRSPKGSAGRASTNFVACAAFTASASCSCLLLSSMSMLQPYPTFSHTVRSNKAGS
mmetsp:Transcript_69436/g.162622  ORF Transcript_69436/g.162622 Transcript_69436/m.162622 type:complete len:160 (-) Transcript_69436:1598-2077(-)